MKATVTKEQGFTLLEVMLAFTILGIAAVSFFAFLSQSMMFSSENESELSGINAAREVLAFIHNEGITTDDFDSAHTLDWSFLTRDDRYQKIGGNAIQFSQNGTDYFIRVVFSSFSGQQPAGENQLQPIAVEVYSDASLRNFVTETFGYIEEGAL